MSDLTSVRETKHVPPPTQVGCGLRHHPSASLALLFLFPKSAGHTVLRLRLVLVYLPTERKAAVTHVSVALAIIFNAKIKGMLWTFFTVLYKMQKDYPVLPLLLWPLDGSLPLMTNFWCDYSITSMWNLLAVGSEDASVFPVLWCTLSEGRQEAVLSPNQSHPGRKTLSPYLTSSEDQACINLFASSYGAVAEQETRCFLPQEFPSREKWSRKLHLSTWLATAYLFAFLHRAKLLKPKWRTTISEGSVFSRTSV